MSTARSSDGRIIERLLRAGMLGSSLLFLASIVAAFVHGRLQTVGVPLFRLRSVLRSATGEDLSEGLAALGVLVLGATPVVRVLLLGWLWLRERDYKFALVAILVAAILAFGIVSGRGG